MPKRKAKVIEESVEVNQPPEDQILEILSQFRDAVSGQDVEKVASALFAHGDILGRSKPSSEGVSVDVILSEGGGEVHKPSSTEDAAFLTFVKGNSLIENWKQNIAEGEEVDMYREQESKWYAAKVIYKEGDAFSVHYNGWQAKHDDHGLVLSESKLFPRGTAVKKKKKPPVKKPKAVHYEILEVNVLVEDEEKKRSAAAVDRSDRRARAARAAPKEDKPPPQKRTKTKAEEDYEDAMRREWVCSICSQLEAPDDSDLILCDGLCKRSFHLMCLNLSEEENAKMLSDDSEWWCEECKAGRHTCFLCGDEGEDHEDVIMCSHANCGKFYHYNCITTQSAPYTLKKKTLQVRCVSGASSGDGHTNDQGEKSSSSTDSGALRSEGGEPPSSSLQNKKTDEGFSQFELKCPYHYCDTCHDIKCSEKPSYGHNRHDSLHKCFRCPRSFHLKCIPPSSRFNDHALLCPNHPNEPLPTFEPMAPRDSSWRSGEDETKGAFSYIWDQLQLPLLPPRSDNVADFGHFRLSSSTEAEINSKPPTFKLIWNNDYDALGKTEEEENYPEGVVAPKVQVPIHHLDEMCECSQECGDDCLNRISKIECFEKANKKDTICKVGKACGNRQFTNREYVKVQPFQEHGMGWGLKAKEDVSAGTLVIEYIGEVITEAQMNRRMVKQAELTPHDHDFYIMELGNGLFVDGKRKGNLSRFINHACDPNCELVRWVVKGRTRIGIFALKEIAAGEPLSYDYQFDTQEADTFRCGCGAAQCRGTMAPKKQVVSKESLSKKELKRLIAAGRKRENKQSLTEEAWKNSCTGKLLPGDGILEVKNGPPKNNFQHARELKLFLPRNTKHTINMTDRRTAMWVRAAAL